MWYLVNQPLLINGMYYNFLPSWWHQNYGVTFGERFVFDPDYRVGVYQFMERTVAERFPELKIGSVDPKPQVISPDFGNAITPAGAGCEITYPIDNYPWNQHLDDEKILSLSVPKNLEEVFPYSEIIRQIHYLNRKLDQDTKPVINPRGVLNDAILIGGSKFFTEFINDSPIAHRLLNYSSGILKTTISHNHEKARYDGIVFLTNCAVMMISPKLYNDSFLSYDQDMYHLVSGFGQEFGIHHCGNFERYTPHYRKIPFVNWLEIGWGSDIKKALDLFPESIVQYILSAVFIANATPQEVDRKIMEILEASKGNWHRFRLSMPDIEFGTPDQNLVQIITTCKKGLPNNE